MKNKSTFSRKNTRSMILKLFFSKMADKPYPTLSSVLATSGLSIRRQSKNFYKNMLMGYYPGKQKRPSFMFHRKPVIFH